MQCVILYDCIFILLRRTVNVVYRSEIHDVQAVLREETKEELQSTALRFIIRCRNKIILYHARLVPKLVFVFLCDDNAHIYTVRIIRR